MRISMGGRYTIDELLGQFTLILEDLRSCDIQEVNNFNVYLNFCEGDRPIRAEDGHGNEIHHLRYEGPRNKRRVRTVCDNVRVVKSKLDEPALDGEIEIIANVPTE